MAHARRSTIVIGTVAGLVLAAQVVIGSAPASAAALLNVTTTVDAPSSFCGNPALTSPTNPLSLRDAVCLANNLGGAVTIAIPAGTYPLNSGELPVGITPGQNVTLQGAGASGTIINANGTSRVLDLDSNLTGGIAVTVTGLTITGGTDRGLADASAPDFGFGGGGIIAGSGTSAADSLTIDSSVITGNKANDGHPSLTNNPGGGVQFIGGSLTITNSTISNNTSGSSPGSGVAYEAKGLGAETITVTASTFTGNATTNAAGPAVTGGALALSGPPGTPMSVTDAAFTANTATGTAGPARGAGLLVFNGALTVTGSTFRTNTVSGTGAGGAVEIEGGTATLHHNRIVDNTAPSASGISVTGGTADASGNWWGCNAGPGAAGCDTVAPGSGPSLTTSPRLVISPTGPAPTVLSGASTSLGADFLTDSAATAVPAAQLTALSGVAMAFSNSLPSGAACTPTSVAIASGSASCTFASNATQGPGSVTATVDHQSVSVPVTVEKAPGITADPTDQTVVAGDSVSFSATADGYPAPTVHWQKSTDGGASFSDIPGATSVPLTFSAAIGDDASKYRAVFTNTRGVQATNPATLTVNVAPAITSAAAAPFTAGTPGSFTVTTSGKPTASTITETGALPSGLSFTDHHDGTATLGGTPAAGTGGVSTISLNASNGVVPDASQTLTITVDEAPTITTNPAATTVAPGATASFTAAATGYPAPTVQWQKSTDGGTSFHDIPGATSTTLAFTAAAVDDGTRYQAVFTNTLNAVTTTDALLTVREGPSITSSASAAFTVGTPGSFTVQTSGVPAVGTITETGALPSGLSFVDHHDGTATLSGTPAAGSGGVSTVSLTASNGVVPDATQTLTITVGEAPAVTTDPVDLTLQPGASGSFSAAASGYPAPSVQWQSSTGGGPFADIAGATNPTLPVTASTGLDGMKYRAVFTNANGSVPSAAATLSVRQAPAFTSTSSTTFTTGSAGTFTVVAGGFPAAAVTATGLPAWLTLTDHGDGTATLAGTPPAGSGGQYPITLHAANGTAPNAAQDFTLTVDEAAAITSADHTTLGVSVAGSFTITTSGYPAPAIVLTGSLPSGVSLVDNGDGTATLAGTPAAGSTGTYPVTITANNGVGAAAGQSFTLTVGKAAQTVTFTSTAPVNPVVGQTYDVSATGGASGNPVTFSTASAACTVAGTTVTFAHAGLCRIDAAQAGDAAYEAGSASQSVTVSQALTTTTVTVLPTAITASVNVVAPGAGAPTGTVDFLIDGTSVGTAPLSGGVATLSHATPTGQAHSVAAVYAGDTDFAASSASTSRHDPRVTATLTSAAPRSRSGWYRTPVVVTFRCTPDGAPLTAPCPDPFTFDRDGAGQSVTRTITATDGGAATVNVRGINLDRTRPVVTVTGIRNGAVYPGALPAVGCSARDNLSGVASCSVRKVRRGTAVTVVATAADNAGNTAGATVRVQVVSGYLIGAQYRNGAFDVRSGSTYTLVVMTRTPTAPRMYDATPHGLAFTRPGPLMRLHGRSAGGYEWTLAIRIDRGLGRYPVWDLGVGVNGRFMRVPFRPGT